MDLLTTSPNYCPLTVIFQYHQQGYIGAFSIRCTGLRGLYIDVASEVERLSPGGLSYHVVDKSDDVFRMEFVAPFWG